MKEPKLIQVLNLVTDEKNFTNPQRGRVYSSDGIAPALNTCGGGGLEPKIIVRVRYERTESKQSKGQENEIQRHVQTDN